jgi:hypothetical protein
MFKSIDKSLISIVLAVLHVLIKFPNFIQLENHSNSHLSILNGGYLIKYAYLMA